MLDGRQVEEKKRRVCVMMDERVVITLLAPVRVRLDPFGSSGLTVGGRVGIGVVTGRRCFLILSQVNCCRSRMDNSGDPLRGLRDDPVAFAHARHRGRLVASIILRRR